MSEWINALDKLPAYDVMVLICHNGCHENAVEALHWINNSPHRIGYLYEALSGDTWMIECRLSGSNYTTKDVTHWMPLPAPPEEE